jgi:hypothetical protein
MCHLALDPSQLPAGQQFAVTRLQHRFNSHMDAVEGWHQHFTTVVYFEKGGVVGRMSGSKISYLTVIILGDMISGRLESQFTTEYIVHHYRRNGPTPWARRPPRISTQVLQHLKR